MIAVLLAVFLFIPIPIHEPLPPGHLSVAALPGDDIRIEYEIDDAGRRYSQAEFWGPDNEYGVILPMTLVGNPLGAGVYRIHGTAHVPDGVYRLHKLGYYVDGEYAEQLAPTDSLPSLWVGPVYRVHVALVVK